MNFFRSEEHMRSWARFDPASDKQVIMPLGDWMTRFSAERFRVRARPDYMSWRAQSAG